MRKLSWKKVRNYMLWKLKVLGIFNHMSDVKYLKLMYRIYIGKKLNLDQPQTFNEKLQWLKLHDRKPEYTSMVDKYEAKKYVAERIGEEYIIPTLGVWDNFEEIDFDSLPNQFVLKTTHDSGGVVICRDKISFDKKKGERKAGEEPKTELLHARSRVAIQGCKTSYYSRAVHGGRIWL